MEPLYVQLLAAIATPLATIFVAHLANEKNKTLIEYKLNELTQRVDKHNNLIERVYRLEGKVAELEKK